MSPCDANVAFGNEIPLSVISNTDNIQSLSTKSIIAYNAGSQQFQLEGLIKSYYKVTLDLIDLERLRRYIGNAAAIHFISGGLAGIVSRTVTAPLDRIKVVMQIAKPNLRIRDVVTLIHMDGGISGFFRGNGVNCLKVAPELGLKFYIYEYYKSLLKYTRMKYLDKEKNLRKPGYSLNSDLTLKHNVSNNYMYERIIAGGFAGATAQLIIYPLEVVKTRMAVSKVSHYTGIFNCALQTFNTCGLRAFYRGAIPAIVGVFPYSGIDLACFETLKSLHSKYKHGVEPSLLELLSFGAISSTLGQIVSYPIALIRTRMQVDGMNGKPRIYTSIFGSLRHVIRTEGPSAVYKGIRPNLIRAVPAISISWVVYESTKNYLTPKVPINPIKL
ncbi:carrier protein [Cryptosporidium andersoni]|uniref:Carrier protein n=1 Tax=Cryptosporidium andersoni TaxID=117008 RepID=A0A1J4MEG4_9CRYT|nr:carrier protein [Cryptosporidium andersoni]